VGTIEEFRQSAYDGTTLAVQQKGPGELWRDRRSGAPVGPDIAGLGRQRQIFEEGKGTNETNDLRDRGIDVSQVERFKGE
jgi:hypothetical protein